ncbi:hypothetical protein F4778DRAFT_752037 [Xylariomycetidae sp. FL2044]|nr:hypothetical protein F4778DRAFT_752037 [Xylariomycetidae sp. FL2044]
MAGVLMCYRIIALLIDLWGTESAYLDWFFDIPNPVFLSVCLSVTHSSYSARPRARTRSLLSDMTWTSSVSLPLFPPPPPPPDLTPGAWCLDFPSTPLPLPSP